MTQSDATVLDLQLRALSKKAGVEPILVRNRRRRRSRSHSPRDACSTLTNALPQVRSIEHADQHPKEIARWIANVAEVHRSKAAPQVMPSKPMPDEEALMQEWPGAIEEILREVRAADCDMLAYRSSMMRAASGIPLQVHLPCAELDLSIEEQTRMACALLDVPVYPGSLVQSAYKLFATYNDFKANPHFANLAGLVAASAMPAPPSAAAAAVAATTAAGAMTIGASFLATATAAATTTTSAAAGAGSGARSSASGSKYDG